LNKVGAVHREKVILSEIEESPLVIKLLATFKDDDYLYFVFENCPYGTLAEVADSFPDQILPKEMTRFYVA
jgi:serine/threonine protein kinase